MILENHRKYLEKELNTIAKSTCISLLKESKEVVLNATGGSMYPLIKEADKIKVSSVKKSSLKVGDIVVFDTGRKTQYWFFAHRIIEIINHGEIKTYRTRGDSQEPGSEQLIFFEQIAGKVISLKRKDVLTVSFEKYLWPYLNPFIGYVSFKFSGSLALVVFLVNFFIEWRWLPQKIVRIVIKGVRLSKRP